MHLDTVGVGSWNAGIKNEKPGHFDLDFCLLTFPLRVYPEIPASGAPDCPYPFDDTDIPKMLWQQQKGVSFPTHLGISTECQDLLKRLLEPDMILRPSIEEVSWHPWLAST